MLDKNPEILAETLRATVQDAQNEAELEHTLGQLLSYASEIVESAAFEMARMDVPRNVTELILIAGRLDRMAQAMSDSQSEETTPN